MKNTIILLDAAHGAGLQEKYIFLNNERIKEGEFNKILLTGIEIQLKAEGYNISVINNGIIDKPIKERIDAANKIIDRFPNHKKFLISLHGVVFEEYKWGCVSKNDEMYGEESRKIADVYCSYAKDILGLPIMRKSIEDVANIKKYGIIKEVNCPAILTENKINNSKKDKTFKEKYSNEDKDKIISLHVTAIKGVIKLVYNE